jgi:demethylmenaquinone methyltransferase/2-methoxy-6-polyprenyl-1,4-benzoquinol methylase
MTDGAGEISGGAKIGRPLKRMFDAVPARYDLLNRLLTFGFDERWRRAAASRCLEDNPQRVLDLCCGTGDLALHVARKADPGTEVIGLDYSPLMLEIARRKAESLSGGRSVRFEEGDASRMEFPDGAFDTVGTAYAFRNLTWHNPLRDEALMEIMRVLRPGGRFVVVETSQPSSRLLRRLFHAYLRIVTAPVGGLISGNRPAYSYLARSAERFHTPEEVSEMLLSAGFSRFGTEPQLGGIAAIHVAIK